MQKNRFIQIAALAAAGVFAQGAFAVEGTINFTGDIVDAPCSIAAGSQSLSVPMGKIARTVFDGATAGTATVGKKAPVPAKFSIDMLGCGATAKGATVTFSGTADADDATNLRLSNSGQAGAASASGVAIELGDSAGTKIALGSASSQYALSAGDNSLKFQAVYVATKAAVTTGPANATAQFTVNYK